ncbi:unnamed protein product [Lactuca saligna]|uniref:Uncharacterized protein n=1 Tax=Lactuca saligna TaxID=75948 RepID=A0AA35VWR3_LACSI|nr:unnamed protein product [Lactuca saligna]
MGRKHSPLKREFELLGGLYARLSFDRAKGREIRRSDERHTKVDEGRCEKEARRRAVHYSGCRSRSRRGRRLGVYDAEEREGRSSEVAVELANGSENEVEEKDAREGPRDKGGPTGVRNIAADGKVCSEGQRERRYGGDSRSSVPTFRFFLFSLPAMDWCCNSSD